MALVDISALKDSITPLKDNLDGWTPIEGDPKMETYIISTTADGTMMSGYWECTPGKYDVTYSAYEYLRVIEGKMVITPKDGDAITVVAGDAVSIEKEFVGTWEVVEKVRKFWSFRVESEAGEKDPKKVKFGSAKSVTVLNPLVETVTPMTEMYPGWTPTEGEPKMKTHVCHVARDKTMESGYWECTPGKFNVKVDAFEFLTIFEGKAIITPKDGKPVNVGPGSAVAVEKGFEGTWEIIDKIRKFWLVRSNL